MFCLAASRYVPDLRPGLLEEKVLRGHGRLPMAWVQFAEETGEALVPLPRRWEPMFKRYLQSTDSVVRSLAWVPACAGKGYGGPGCVLSQMMYPSFRGEEWGRAPAGPF